MYLHPGVETADTLACLCCKVVAVVVVFNEARNAKTAEQNFDCLATPELAAIRRAKRVAIAVIDRWVDSPFVHHLSRFQLRACALRERASSTRVYATRW